MATQEKPEVRTVKEINAPYLEKLEPRDPESEAKIAQAIEGEDFRFLPQENIRRGNIISEGTFMMRVFVAELLLEGDRDAISVAYKEYTGDPGTLRGDYKGLEMAHEISPENFPRVYGYTQKEGGEFAVVTELVEGKTLERLATEGTEIAEELFERIEEVTRALHRRGLSMGDTLRETGENIMLRKNKPKEPIFIELEVAPGRTDPEYFASDLVRIDRLRKKFVKQPS